MDSNSRFQDQKKTARDFYNEVWVACPTCQKKAITTADFDKKVARLFCVNCGCNKDVSTEAKIMGITANVIKPANTFFNAELWLIYPFKNDFFCAYNGAELDYLEQYISAGIREHKDRTGFTLLEKLPKFYHEAKNRDALLKIIKKLRSKK